MKKLKFSIITFIVSLLVIPLLAQERIDTLTYSKQEVMIPMRDGVKLFTVIYTPKSINEPLPFLILRTPYGVSTKPSPNKTQYQSDMAMEGYIFVYQDIRGRYRSEGLFEMQRLMRDKNNPNAIDESTDTYDGIDWLIKNIPNNNGKAGMLGVSYDGWTTMIRNS